MHALPPICFGNTPPTPSNRTKVRNSTGIRGRSPAIRKLRRAIKKAALFPNYHVLIVGETGTGKELVAKAIHQQCERSKQGAYVPINCGQFDDATLTSELFGHKKGAFTGADAKHTGLVMQANKGTLFLDEFQVAAQGFPRRLLRLMEDGSFHSMNSEERGEKTDIRIVAATNQAPRKLIEGGQLLPDLLYRFKLSIHIPPLRRRKEDIRLLTHHLLRKIREENKERITDPIRISKAAIGKLMTHDWPGNVRELENRLTRAVVRLFPLKPKTETVDIRIQSKDIKLPKPKPPKKSTIEADAVLTNDEWHAITEAHPTIAKAQGKTFTQIRKSLGIELYRVLHGCSARQAYTARGGNHESHPRTLKIIQERLEVDPTELVREVIRKRKEQ